MKVKYKIISSHPLGHSVIVNKIHRFPQFKKINILDFIFGIQPQLMGFKIHATVEFSNNFGDLYLRPGDTFLVKNIPFIIQFCSEDRFGKYWQINTINLTSNYDILSGYPHIETICQKT